MNFEKSIRNLVNINSKINVVIDNYKPKTNTRYENKKRVVSILNEIRKSILDFYVHYDSIFKLTKKYHSQRLDKALWEI